MANSDKRIIYTNDDGSISIVVPTDNCGLTVEQIQAKDVPSGKTSYIVFMYFFSFSHIYTKSHNLLRISPSISKTPISRDNRFIYNIGCFSSWYIFISYLFNC